MLWGTVSDFTRPSSEVRTEVQEKGPPACPHIIQVWPGYTGGLCLMWQQRQARANTSQAQRPWWQCGGQWWGESGDCRGP